MVQKPNINQTIPVKIQYVKVEDVAYFHAKKNEAYIELIPGKEFENFENSKLTINIRSNISKTKYGISPVSSINFNIPGNDNNLSSQIYSILNAKLIFKITLADGQELLLGTKKKPCFISMKEETQYNSSSEIIIQKNDIFRYLTLEDYPAGFTTGFSFGFRS